jgi:hypothetical protein
MYDRKCNTNVIIMKILALIFYLNVDGKFSITTFDS